MFRKYWHSFAPQWSVGIDVGSANVKLVCLEEKSDGFELKFHAMFKRENINGIKQLMRHTAVKAGDIRIAIKDPKLVIQKIDLPDVPQSELDEIVKWAVKDLSAPVEEYEFRYERIGESAGKTVAPHIAFALEKARLKQHLDDLKNIGINRIKILEPDINALAHSVVHNYAPKKDDCFALVDIGKSETIFGIVTQKGLLFSSVLQGISGSDLTSMICENHGVSEKEAESYKTQTADLLRGDGVDETEGVIQYLSKTSIAIQSAFDSYALLRPNESITHLFLSGGGARLKILRPYIQDTLKFPTDVLKNFARIDTSNFSQINFMQFQEFFGTAIGLAL